MLFVICYLLFIWPCGCSLRGFFRGLSCSLSYHCVKCIMSSAVITLFGKRLFFSLVCGLYTACHGLFAVPLGVIGRL